jgi:2'-5' RNA ligase
MSSARVEPARRVFFALWPQAGVREALDQAALGWLGKRIKRMPAEKLHLTLAYAGPVSPATYQCLEVAAAAVQSPPFALAIDRIGHWPRPRILWAGPQHTPPALWSLVGQLRAVLAQCGIPPETRPYQAHITIARKLSRAQALAEIEPIDWSISQFSLVESVTDPAGVRYQLLRSWELEG